MISEGMASMSYYIVMAFVAAHFVALFNWSNLGVILAINGRRDWEAGVACAGPDRGHRRAGRKHQSRDRFGECEVGMLAPVLVPMLMLLGSRGDDHGGISHGDSVTNPITPLLVYFPLVLVFCQRWIPGFGMGSLIAAMLPYSLGFLVIAC